MRWHYVHVGPRGDQLTIGNRRVWREEWRWINGDTVRLPDPLDPTQLCSYMVCEIGPPAQPVRFAAHKLPSNLWSFYAPD